MIKKYLGIFLLAVFLLIPANDIKAAEEPTFDSLIGQINALTSYLERTFNIVQTEPLSDAEMREIIIEGAEWLKNSQEDTGHFAYEYQPYDDTYLRGDNIVRQAGALYELGEIVRRDPEKKIGLSKTIESSIAYFEDLSREDTFLKVNFRCIVADEESTECKLGATSLALIGILSYVEAYPEKEQQYEALIEDYVAYIMGAKNLQTGFRNIHYVGEKSQPNKESPFSNGEALLALTRYNQYKENQSVSVVIDDVFSYLKDEPYDTALFLWIMAALKDLHSVEPSDEYVSYAKDFTNWRVGRVQPFKNTDKNYCAYVEGVASAYSILDGSVTTEDLQVVRAEIDFWNVKNRRLQIGSEDRYRAENDDGSLTFLAVPNMALAKGGFLTSDDVLTQRIDFTQHCISAYLQTLVDIDGVQL